MAMFGLVSQLSAGAEGAPYRLTPACIFRRYFVVVKRSFQIYILLLLLLDSDVARKMAELVLAYRLSLPCHGASWHQIG